MSNTQQQSQYENQVRLLIDILPIVMKDPRFALKGGTALNLFVRDLPRFSVDIDLTYLPMESRTNTISAINGMLQSVALAIAKSIRGSKVTPSRPFDAGRELKIFVEVGDTLVKVEANYILRGSVFPSETRDLLPSCRQRFSASASVNVMSLADLYGGKICAALDRQHPRDLFDVKLLLKHEGLTTDIRQAFLVYLMSHNRPMSELLDPRWKDLTKAFSTEFAGMAIDSVTLAEIIETRINLLAAIRSSMTNEEQVFLLEFKGLRPDWSKFPYPQVEHLPGIQWRLKNLREISPSKHKEMVQKLEQTLLLPPPKSFKSA